MRIFRIKCRTVSNSHKKGKVSNIREYLGIENFLKYGKDTFHRYNRPGYGQYLPTVAEVYEHVDGKWNLLTEQSVKEIFDEK